MALGVDPKRAARGNGMHEAVAIPAAVVLLGPHHLPAVAVADRGEGDVRHQMVFPAWAVQPSGNDSRQGRIGAEGTDCASSVSVSQLSQ